MPDRVLAEIEADIAEAERLISELRLEIAAKTSAGEDTSRSEQRVLEMLKGWMLLEDQRQKALQLSQVGSLQPIPSRLRSAIPIFRHPLVEQHQKVIKFIRLLASYRFVKAL